MNGHNLNLRSRRGEGYVTLMIVLLPLLLTAMVYVFDGLSVMIAYRRAQGLATLGIQAVASAPVFTGNAVGLPGTSCATATTAICATSGDACAAGRVRVACSQQGNTINVRVGVRPNLLGSGLGLNIQYAAAEARGGPRYGINFGE